MKTKDLKDSIKAALKLGGLVIAPRTSGKTRALREILCEDPNAIVFTDNSVQKEHLIEKHPALRKRVFINSRTSRTKIAWIDPLFKVYIDEYTPGNDYPNFFAAVTSRAKVLS